MSDSDESEHIGYLVEQSDHHESDESDELDARHDDGESGSSDSESGSESGSEDPARELLDLEAVDSDEEKSSSAGESDAASWSDNYFFPQFKRLPLELRTRIWEFFCPDLAANGRVYWFQLQEPIYRRKDRSWEFVVQEGPLLEQQTRSSRAMLAVSHESRQLALKAFPDTLLFGGHGVLRFNAQKDIVILRSTNMVPADVETMHPLPGFSEHIRHLAVEPAALADFRGRRLFALFGAFENLKTAYYVTSAADHKPQHLRWCTSDLAKRYIVATFEEQPGLGEDAHHLFCWPDLERCGALAAENIPLDGLTDDLSENFIEIKGTSFNGAPIWPLVEFLTDYGLERFEELVAWDGEGKLWSGSSEDEDRGEPDEYESEGIDDSEISDDDGEESDDQELVVLDDDDHSDQDEEGSGEGSSVASGSPPQRRRRGETIDLTGVDHESAARFSSPERSSATLQGSEGSASESDQPVPRTSRLKRPRGRVVGSDSEDGQDDDVPRKRARTGSRGIAIILSSDDDEDEMRKMRANRRVRAVISEDEEEDDDREGGETVSDVSSSEDEDEDPEGGAAVSKPLSLAEKLQLHRERNPIPLSDDGDSDIEEMRGDDYDARDYADFQDDEEGNEFSEDREDDDQQELIMDDEDEEGYQY
jgi:hypothetical protein